MAKKNNTFKQITIREHPVQSLFEAGIYGLDLKKGDQLIGVANLLFPVHDESKVQLALRHIKDIAKVASLTGNTVHVIMFGPAVDEESAKGLWNKEMNFIHTQDDPEVVKEALKQRGYDKRIMYFWKQCGKFIKRFAVPGVQLYYLPSHINLGLPNEHDMFEDAHQTKRVLDNWTANNPEATDRPSTLGIDLPEGIAEAFGLTGVENIQVLPFGAGILINNNTIATIGAFRRRQPGDAPHVQWEQTGYNVIMSVDGKSSSAWWTRTDSNLPESVFKEMAVYQLGYLWSRQANGHLGDYNRRASSIGSWIVGEGGILHGRVAPFMPGKKDGGRLHLLIRGKVYQEDKPSTAPNGRQLTVSQPVDRDVTREAAQFASGKRKGKKDTK